jgi:hypothetical protein
MFFRDSLCNLLVARTLGLSGLCRLVCRLVILALSSLYGLSFDLDNLQIHEIAVIRCFLVAIGECGHGYFNCYPLRWLPNPL